MVYIHQLPGWPSFIWNSEKTSPLLAAVRHRQGRLLGHMEALGFDIRAEAMLHTLTLDVLKSTEIEGEILNPDQVRSSIAKRLGMDIAGLVTADRNVEGVVEMMLDATQNYDHPLTQQRLFGWQASLFPTGYSGIYKITVGGWRLKQGGPMQVVSGGMGREKIHYEAPEADILDKEMEAFLKWFNNRQTIDPVLKAAIAHLWFVTIHPFDDGNGRIARAIADMQLARADGSAQRFYSMSAQIQKERNVYYDMLESTQKDGMDVTRWVEWFLNCLDRALTATSETLGNVLSKAEFWNRHANAKLNERQKLMLNKLLDGFVGKLTSSKWAKMMKCSNDTALRDINDLISQDILAKDETGGRSTAYALKGNDKMNQTYNI